MATQTSIFRRKLDMVYWVYFFIHGLVVILVDTAALLPPHQRFSISNTFFEIQTKQYLDQFFVKGDIQFFNFFRWMEIGLHLPVSLWALKALITDDYKTPIVLFAFAVQTAVTTATCMYDYAFWNEIDYEAKWKLTGLYGPYLVIATFMGIDMYLRLKKSLVQLKSLKAGKKMI